MKKIQRHLFLLTFLSLLSIGSSYSQCNNFLNVSLDAQGNATVFAENFVEGNPDYDLVEVSLDNSNFGPSVSFDCEDVDIPITVYVEYTIDGQVESCSSMVQIEDKLGPIVIAVDFTINLTSIVDTYDLQVSDIDGGNFDNCSVEYELSQVNFSSNDWGANVVSITATDVSGNVTQASCTVTVLIDGQIPSIVCLSNLVATVQPWGQITVWGSDFVENASSYTQILISTNPAGPFTESLDFDCWVDALNQEMNIYIQAYLGSEFNTCTSSLTLSDNTPPVAVAVSEYTIQIVTGTVTLEDNALDNGSYDACGGPITFELSQNTFSASDEGTNIITTTVTDIHGNVNSVWSEVHVIVDGETSCNLENVQYPSDLNIFDEDGDPENLSIENLQSIYGYSYAQVHPTTEEECDNIVHSYTDLVIPFPDGVKVLRNWVSLDWFTTEIKEVYQVIKLYYDENLALACNTNITVSVADGSVTLTAMDILEGVGYNFENLTLELNDEDGILIPNNVITASYAGQTITATVTHTNGNSCWSTIEVVGDNGGCPLDFENEVSLPLPEIFIPNTGLEASALTPAYLISDLGFTEEEVAVTITSFCAIAAYVYEDEVFNFIDGNYKIIRTFTIIDWTTYNPGSTQGVWTAQQTINVGVDPQSLICDTEPNSAPIGDCDSGHTLDDDVEWPSDLDIADYRITPEELIEFSGVSEENASPIFFNEPDSYEASYQDFLLDLSPTTLTIGRSWTATRSDYGLSWTYQQTIVVDITDFDELVTISTGTNRAVPGVMINNSISTNMNGTALVEEEITSLSFEDFHYLNGLNVRDIIQIQRHILGLQELDEGLLPAADVNGTNTISAADIVEIRKTILGFITEGTWIFEEGSTESVVKPKAIYKTFKLGDVDDSAMFVEEEQVISTEFEIDDLLLNNGESYDVPLYLKRDGDLFGLEIRLGINPDLIEIDNISSNLDFWDSDFHVNDDNELVVVLHNFNEAAKKDQDAVINFQFTAKANGLLNEAIITDGKISYGVDENIDLFIIGGTVNGLIGTGTNDEELAAISVYPNPTTDYLFVDRADINIKGEMVVDIFDMNGKKLLTTSNEKVNVQNLAGGMYYYRVSIGELTTTGKFIVVK